MAIFLAVFLLLGPTFSHTQDAAGEAADKAEKKPLTGDEIIAKVRDKEHSSAVDSTVTMTLVDKNDKVQRRVFTLQRKDENVLIRFLDPADIKNTGYLIFKDEKGEEQVYVYFPPPTDDYRKINVEDNSSSQSFLGSDFDITDFQLRDPEDATNKYIKTETVAGIECHVVESVPKDPDYKYRKAVSWVRSDYWLPIRVQFFDGQGKMAKELKVFKFKTVEGRKVASKFQMQDLTKEHKTVMEVEQIKFEVSFAEDHFTIRNLTHP